VYALYVKSRGSTIVLSSTAGKTKIIIDLKVMNAADKAQKDGGRAVAAHKKAFSD